VILQTPKGNRNKNSAQNHAMPLLREKSKGRVAVGLSGGVDSSVALLLLKRQGYEPVGVSLKMAVWKNECNGLLENVCCTEESFANARLVCEKLGVEHAVYDVSCDFERSVMGYFADELRHGRTPNPCLVCNRDLKIKKLFEWAEKHGIKCVATGHYACIVPGKQGIGKEGKEEARLCRASDMKKDQSYGLCLLPRKWLSRLILPLGALSKQQVYDIAIKEGLGFYTGVKQSQDLCFVSEKAMKQFLFEKIGKREGPIIDEDGKKIGTHYGLFLYTIGQRRGLGFSSAHFVKGFDVQRNALLATRERKNVLGRKMVVEDFNWLSKPRARKFSAYVQIRTHQPPVRAVIAQHKGMLEVVCEEPIEGIAPGQICAVYMGKACLGGGPIANASPAAGKGRARQG
jgi:tRNA-specific 2-thiouridylase